MKRNRNLFQNESYLHSAYNCFLPLSLPLFGPFRFPFFILFAVFFPLQPFMLILLIAVISRKHNWVIKSSTCICESKISHTVFWNASLCLENQLQSKPMQVTCSTWVCDCTVIWIAILHVRENFCMLGVYSGWTHNSNKICREKHNSPCPFSLNLLAKFSTSPLSYQQDFPATACDLLVSYGPQVFSSLTLL